MQDLPAEFHTAHKKISLTDEANVVRNCLLQVEHQLTKDDQKFTAKEFTTPEDIENTDIYRRSIFHQLQDPNVLVADCHQKNFLQTFNKEIKVGLYLVIASVANSY